jgi:pyruvate,water dikinase
MAKPPKLQLNISVPSLAQKAAELPADGVGLLRAEFMCLASGRHPQLLLEEGGEEGYVSFFREGLAEVAEAFAPRPVTYRACDLKSNEYRALEGGERFEPQESNPMIGVRGVHRYLTHQAEFALELRAIRQVREQGLRGVKLMLPFVRTAAELIEARKLIADAGLSDEAGFEVWAMAEVPSVAILPESFAAEVDGLSIGSNDLVQLVLGVDRDSAELSAHFGADDPAVREAMRRIIDGAHRAGKPVSICGDHASVDEGLVRFLVEAGIDTISVVSQAFEATRALVDELCGATSG